MWASRKIFVHWKVSSWTLSLLFVFILWLSYSTSSDSPSLIIRSRTSTGTGFNCAYCKERPIRRMGMPYTKPTPDRPSEPELTTYCVE